MKRDLGTVGGTQSTETKSAPSAVADKAFSEMILQNSRGGTRTRDPGIMSAVL
jgi:hypothetical protein